MVTRQRIATRRGEAQKYDGSSYKLGFHNGDQCAANVSDFANPLIWTHVVSTVFAATTGIVGASVVTMGMLSIPVLLKCGYKPSLACGMVCAGGSLGILIPPSIMLVSMGSYAEVSDGKIFFAAIVPGLLLSLCYMILCLSSAEFIRIMVLQCQRKNSQQCHFEHV